ncbi:MAG: flavodoxin [Euryarchaeota archaeon]|nr:flavodoxin [Euryarchaeota archaeon]
MYDKSKIESGLEGAKKIVLIYDTTSGNTKELAEDVVDGLTCGGAEVVVKNVTDAGVDELGDYDAIVFGCPTYGEGELQDEDGFVDFNDAMSGISLNGKKAAVFGPGDSEEYPDTFCMAVDILEETLRNCGAEIVVEGLKIDGDVVEAIGMGEEWGSKVAESL